MTNREKYKQAFSVLRASDGLALEAELMKKTAKRQKIRTAAAAVAACVLLAGGSTAAYAANVGGIQRTVQLWVHGDQTDAVIDFTGDGSYTMSYDDGTGNAVQRGGGGVAYNWDGSERALTQEELLDLLDDPEVEYEDDGSVWVYYYDQRIDITDRFENGVCYVQVSNGDETQYMTIKYGNGWCSSLKKFQSPSTFN